MQRAGGKAASSGITRAKVERLAPSGRSGKAELWVTFWACVDQVGEHYLWRTGRALFVPNKGPPLPASHVAWAYDGRELTAGEKLRTSCGRQACVRPDHQAVLRGAP